METARGDPLARGVGQDGAPVHIADQRARTGSPRPVPAPECRVGDVPLFPAPKLRKIEDADPVREEEVSIGRETVMKWLVRAEKLAELTKLKGGVFHPYRRLWATERKQLPDVDVAAAGGWKDTQALRLSYQHADAATVLRVVEAS